MLWWQVLFKSFKQMGKILHFPEVKPASCLGLKSSFYESIFTVHQIDFWLLPEWMKQGFYPQFFYVTFLLPFLCSVLRPTPGRVPSQLSRGAQQPYPSVSADLPGSAAQPPTVFPRRALPSPLSHTATFSRLLPWNNHLSHRHQDKLPTLSNSVLLVAFT